MEGEDDDFLSSYLQDNYNLRYIYLNLQHVIQVYKQARLYGLRSKYIQRNIDEEDPTRIQCQTDETDPTRIQCQTYEKNSTRIQC